uniref:C1q n=1 Tax=Sinonovacula constricta TaxID=98310 RepID=A0A3Q8EP61_SINCO|nr:C1q [Sinonovacula constricta]
MMRHNYKLHIVAMVTCIISQLVQGGLLPPEEVQTEASSDRKLIQQLIDRLGAMETREARLESRVNQLERTNRQLESELFRLDQLANQQKGHLESITNATIHGHGRSERAVGPSKPIAFTAWAQNDQLDMGINQNIQFEHVVNNVGNAYNSHAGIFVAPVTGIYVFSVTTLAYPGIQAYYRVSVNDSSDSKAWIFVRNSPSQGEQGATTVTLILMSGDIVSVKNLGQHGAVHGGGFTSFSGFLLYTTV